MLKSGAPSKRPPKAYQLIDVAGDEGRRVASEQKSTISAFLKDLQELGIGEQSRGTEEERVKKPLEEVRGDQLSSNDNWVPLEMSFGIPLFNEAANSSVCNKVGDSACFHLGGH